MITAAAEASADQDLMGAEHLSVDKRSPIPLHVQLKTQLLRIFSRQNVRPGQQFYTDDQLVNMFGVSRTTVREAVRGLIDDGYLYRVRGVGTFLASPVRDRLDRMESFFKTWAVQGQAVSAQVRTAAWAECPEWAAQLLEVDPGSRVFYVHRIRIVDDVPIASDHRYLAADLAPHVSIDALGSKTILEILTEHVPGDPPASARFIVEAAAASASDAYVLGIPEGAPVLVRRHVLNSQAGHPMTAGSSAFRPELKWSIEFPYPDR